MKDNNKESVLGIIAEYNPFHNGHLYHLTESKKITNSKYVIAVIGNDFTERGDCSIFDKWTKTKLALENGIDLVIELPAIYSSSSAENFAYGAIAILDSLGIVDYLSFGSENGDIDSFIDISNNYIYENNTKFSNLLKEELKNGNSYPKAMSIALDKISNNKYPEFLTPNNILGLEYISALNKLNSKITPITIKRSSNDFNNKNIDISSSASSIRNALLCSENNLSKVSKLVPKNTFNLINALYKNNSYSITTLNSFEKEIIYILKRMSLEEIKNLPDVSEGLEYKIKESCIKSSTLEDLISSIKSKRFTNARIQRILIYALLGITKQDLSMSKEIIPYARVLGFSSNGKELISKIIKKNKNVNIITSLKKFENSCVDANLKRLLEIDMFSTQIYNSTNYNNIPLNDYTQKIVEID